MIQLYLNNEQVFPADRTSTRLTMQNVFFTKSASYTLDIELPLSIPANRRVFGWIDRIDISKAQRQFDARLIIDNVEVLIGLATITSSSETSVKVQLLGEASAYNYRNRFDKLYIDELDLRDFGMYSLRGFDWHNILRVPCGIMYDVTSVFNTVYGHRYPFVLYPVRNTTNDIIFNNLLICYRNSTPYLRGLSYEVNEDGHTMSYHEDIAYQPYLWYVAKMVAQATGFTLSDTNNALLNDELFGKIFIANANPYVSIAKMLPHWSVNEWWTQIENTFGLVVKIDYASRTMRLLSRASYYGAASPIAEVSSVVDEFSVEMDDETQTDISVCNVGYADHESGREDILPEYVVDNADINRDFADINELVEWSRTQTTISKATLFVCADGRQYIYADSVAGFPGFEEVNMLRPRIVNEDKDVEVRLKFVPARFAPAEIGVYNMDPDHMIPLISKDAFMGTINVTIIERPDVEDISQLPSSMSSIEDVINEDEEVTRSTADTKPDVIYLAIENEDGPDGCIMKVNKPDGTFEFLDGSVPVPRAHIRERSCYHSGTPAPFIAEAPYSLSLIPIDGQINIASQTIVQQHVEIDTTVKHAIKFVSDHIPDTEAIFLIRNRRFVCERIEVDITSKGISRLMTGYFYEISM